MIAADGCCQGHACDACRSCLRGQCCRKDNPDYQLPKEGDWEAAFFGEIGKVNRLGDALECHVCGEWFESLGSHIWRSHDLLAAEYKSIFGLNDKTPLISERVSAVKSQKQTARILDGRARSFGDTGFREAVEMTPEQLSALHSGRRPRAERRIKPLPPRQPVSDETRFRLSASISRQRESRRQANGLTLKERRNCSICHSVYEVFHWSKKKTCSQVCRAALIGRGHAGARRSDSWRQHMSESMTRRSQRMRDGRKVSA